jgi:uncharacterized protein (TIGR02266 family)
MCSVVGTDPFGHIAAALRLPLSAPMNERAPRPSPALPNLSLPSSDVGVMPNSLPDQRGANRVVVDVEVSLASESHFFVGLTRNLSQGGLFVATWRRLPVGTPLDLVLTLPDGIVTARARVRWVRDATEVSAPGIGVMFEGLGEGDRQRIEVFCAERAPYYFDVEE